MLGSVATKFAQFLPGYTGRNTDQRGRHPEEENLWSLPELQDLLDEWIVAKWQNRPHEGLRDPDHPGRLFTPNQKYAALVEACGYVPVALSGQDYIELLPAAWQAVNSYGIRINNRTYDAPELGPMRRHDSGITAKRGLTVPPAATPRMIAAEFARFLGLPVLRSSNITDLTEAVVCVCTKARTGLVLVDFTDRGRRLRASAGWRRPVLDSPPGVGPGEGARDRQGRLHLRSSAAGGLRLAGGRGLPDLPRASRRPS